MNSKTKGNMGEDTAVEFLQNKNYTIVTRNFYCKGGEIDIIAYKNGVFHFIEVKSGINFEPVYNITPQKIKRIIKCAYFYMKKNKINEAFCIDAIIIKNEKIDFLENLTL
ncbi:YraN family protein [Caminibacter sp.]